MGTVEDPHLAKQHHRNPAALSLADFFAQFQQQAFHLPPGDVRAHRPGEDEFKRALVLALHLKMVLFIGTFFEHIKVNAKP